MGHDGLFHQVLDLLHGGAAAHFLAGGLHALGNTVDLQGRHAHLFIHRVVGFRYCHYNFIDVKADLGTVSFDDLHH